MTQLAEWSLLIPADTGLDPAIENLPTNIYFLSKKTKNKARKRPEWSIFTKVKAL